MQLNLRFFTNVNHLMYIDIDYVMLYDNDTSNELYKKLQSLN